MIVTAVLAACSDDPMGTAPVDRVEVGPAGQVLLVGDSTELTAVPLTAGGDVVVGPVLWRSLNPAVAALRASGAVAVIEAKAPGSARIEAESGGRVGYVDVTVDALPQVAVVDLLPTTLVLEVGQETTIRAVARRADGQEISGRDVTWNVTPAGVATVVAEATPGSARVTAHAPGEVVIHATVDGIGGEAEVQVVTATPAQGQVATVVIAPSDFSLPVNHETSLQAIAKTATGEIVDGLPVAWTSSADGIATVTPIGISSFASVKTEAPGAVTIRATVGGVTGEATVQVTAIQPPPGQVFYLMFSPNHRGIWVNQPLDFSQHLFAIGANGTIPDPAVTWAVDDATVASVDAAGVVRGLAAGTTKVWANMGSLRAFAWVTVFQPSAGVAVYDLTYDWWDGQWRMAQQVGTESWTDELGAQHEVALWLTGGTLAIADDGQYERVLSLEGWVQWNGSGRKVVEREVVDRGMASIIIGGETGYVLRSATTPGYQYEVVSAANAGHVVMRAAVGTTEEHDYMFRLRQ